jgi:hypothetical protein
MRTEARQLELFREAEIEEVRAPPGRPEAFSDFTGFAGGDVAVRLGSGAASLDPRHAVRAVVGFIAED